MTLLLTHLLYPFDGDYRPAEMLADSQRILRVEEPGTIRGADEVRDVGGACVSPGWVDIHVHLRPKFTLGIGVGVGRLGPATGVTGLVDAGTVGSDGLARWSESVVGSSPVPIKIWINIKRTGIGPLSLGRIPTGLADLDAIELCNRLHPDLIAGVKVLASREHSANRDPLHYLELGLEAGHRIGKPTMVHIGITPPNLSQILPRMREGDILTHCFRNGGHTILGEDGKVRSEVWEARERGVRFDVGHGVKSFSFPVAEAALAQGFDDFSISSDLHFLSAPYRARSMANVLGRFLTLGIPVEEIMRRASSIPAEWVGWHRGLKPGDPALLTLFKVEEGEFIQKDCWNVARKATQRLRAHGAVVDGCWVSA